MTDLLGYLGKTKAMKKHTIVLEVQLSFDSPEERNHAEKILIKKFPDAKVRKAVGGDTFEEVDNHRAWEQHMGAG